jgi:hypothetical protein
MRSSLTGPFEAFAAEYGLLLTAEILYSAPRDVISPPSEMDQHSLVTLSRTGHEARRIRLVFVTSLSDAMPIRSHDVLWWLAGDAWAIERARRSLPQWCSAHGYPQEDRASVVLFERHATQASSLRALLGQRGYSRLLDLYATEVRGARTAP